MPVLAAIDGVCIGGALEFAASCDLRIATDRARFGTPEVGIGLTYTNAGSHFLPSTMGETAARELLLTGALRDVAWARAPPLRQRGRPGRRLRRAHRGLGRAASTTSRAPPWRAPRRCSTTASATCSAAAMEREERACIELFDGPDAPAALASFAERRR